MKDFAFDSHGKAFFSLRGKMEEDGKPLDAVHAAYAAMIQPYYLTIHRTIEGRPYRHFEVGIIQDGNKRTLMVLGGDSRHQDALEMVWQLAEARREGAHEIKQQVRRQLGLD